MKRVFIASFSLLIILLLAGCSGSFSSNNKSSAVESVPDHSDDYYTGSFYYGNYIWGGAMNLAWNELSENIIKEEIKLNSTDESALTTTNKLNKSVFSKKDLDENSYYVKSGYGQSTVDLINKESRQKFPSKSFEDLDITLKDSHIISYAYFLKEVEYLVEFTKGDVQFQDEKVNGFYASSKEQDKNINIIKYWNDDKFIISLNLKDKADELILAKGFEKAGSSELVAEINKYKTKQPIASSDVFKMPELHLDYNRTYSEMVNRFLANPGFEDYFISQMYENIKFDMDNKGARVENEAVIVLFDTAIANPLKIKKLILDKPFWVVMRRTGSQNPYFIIQVNNSNIMGK